MKDNTAYGAIADELKPYEVIALRELFPEIGEGEISPGRLSIDRGVGNPNSAHFVSKNKVNGREYVLRARYYDRVPEEYNGSIPAPVKDFRSYQFLREAGVRVPRVVYLEDAPGWLFMEDIEGTVLSKEFEESDEGRREEILKEVITGLANFQYSATKEAAKLPEEERTEIFWSRSVEEQSLGYHEAYLGGKRDAKKVVEELFLPLFGDSLRGDVISHGDPSLDNIIRDESGELVWIDFELKRRNPAAGLGCLLSYVGDYEDSWKRLGEGFRLERIRLNVEGENGQLRADPFRVYLLGKNPYRLSTEGKGQVYFETLANILNFSLRRVEKRIKDSESTEEQRQMIMAVIKKLESSSGEFGLDAGEEEMVHEYRRKMDRKKNG